MSTAYLPPISRSAARLGASLLREAHQSGPTYARSRLATRWHMVRSAVSWIADWANDDTIRITYHYWCGPWAREDALLADDLPRNEPLCGTCYGRSRGADPDDADLVFSPLALVPPRICPATKTVLAKETAYNRGVCLVCGERVKLGSSGGPYNPHWGIRSHVPGPGLVDGCEFHAWRELVRTSDDQIACRCKCVAVSS